MRDDELQNILSKVFENNIILEKDNIQVDGLSFQRNENFINFDSVESNIDQEKISDTFGKEWLEYSDILQEYNDEFENYFDVVPEKILSEKILVLDVGCGKGRWSYEFLKRNPKAIVVCLDISDAIIAAQKNLELFSNRVIFLKADITKLSIRKMSFDFIFSLGVIHHIPGNLYENLRFVTNLSNRSLIYLYYSLDNRGFIYKSIFSVVNLMRIVLSSISSEALRKFISKVILFFLYLPLILIGKSLRFLHFPYSSLPLNYYVQDFSLKRIEQDVYDRFFTHIEKRISRQEIINFSQSNDMKANISDSQPFWHFYLEKN